MLLLILAAPRLLGQDSIPSVSIRSTPAPLGEGSIGWIEVRSDSVTSIESGEAGGEPLHLERTDDGWYRALVGVPVEVGDSFAITPVRRGPTTDTVKVSLPVRPADYPHEVLTVPPAFVKPDSISALRIQSEIAQSREVSQRSHHRARLWRSPFVLPRPSRITSRFGAARLYNGEVQSRHLGTDFAGAIGSPVRAA